MARANAQKTIDYEYMAFHKQYVQIELLKLKCYIELELMKFPLLFSKLTLIKGYMTINLNLMNN